MLLKASKSSNGAAIAVLARLGISAAQTRDTLGVLRCTVSSQPHTLLHMTPPMPLHTHQLIMCACMLCRLPAEGQARLFDVIRSAAEALEADRAGVWARFGQPYASLGEMVQVGGGWQDSTAHPTQQLCFICVECEARCSGMPAL